MANFDDWRRAYEAFLSTCAAQDRQIHLARLLNLLSEDRVPLQRISFETELVSCFDDLHRSGRSEPEAAFAALAQALFDSARHGHHSFSMASSSSFPNGSTYVTAAAVAQFGGLGDIDTADPPARLPTDDGCLFEGSGKSILWITPDAVSSDPDAVALQLGLPHFIDYHIYRFSVATGSVQAYLPSCFDAGLYEAWQAGLSSEAGYVGRTRHVETGDRVWSELIVRMTDVQGGFDAGERLPLGQSLRRVAFMAPDYLVGR